VTKSYNTGDVTATIENTSVLDVFAGGIVGRTYGTISETYNTGDITAEVEGTSYVYAAGIAGLMSYSGNVLTLTKNAAANDYVTVSTTGNKYINRILGDRTSSAYASVTIEHNFALIGMSVDGASGTSELKGEDKEASDFKTKNTYSNNTSSGGLGWGFGNNDENPWVMPTPDGSGHPRLYWQTD
jgi:hypothetical protein